MSRERDPSTLPCGHTFCNKCAVSSAPNCPNCRKPFQPNNLAPAINQRSIVDELESYCVYKSRDCSWIGEYGELETHIKNCPKITKFCTYCDEEDFVDKIISHEVECPMNVVPCSNSGCEWKGQSLKKVEHEGLLIIKNLW